MRVRLLFCNKVMLMANWFAIQSNTILYYAIQWNTMQYHAIQSNTIKWLMRVVLFCNKVMLMANWFAGPLLLMQCQKSSSDPGSFWAGLILYLETPFALGPLFGNGKYFVETRWWQIEECLTMYDRTDGIGSANGSNMSSIKKTCATCLQCMLDKYRVSLEAMLESSMVLLKLAMWAIL